MFENKINHEKPLQISINETPIQISINFMNLILKYNIQNTFLINYGDFGTGATIHKR